jgi:hypothetical protein
MTNLKEIHGLNTFCGPAVLSALTGRSTDECASVIQAITGQTTIKGVYVRDMVRALNKLKFDIVHVDGGRTLYGTIIRLSNQDGFYIIVVPHHYVALEVVNKQAYLIDNHSKQPLIASSSARLMQRVEQVLKVIKKEEPKFIGSQIRLDRVMDYKNNAVQLNIFRISRYENPSDDVEMKVGTINFKTIEDLVEVIKSLAATYL